MKQKLRFNSSLTLLTSMQDLTPDSCLRVSINSQGTTTALTCDPSHLPKGPHIGKIYERSVWLIVYEIASEMLHK